MCLEYLHCVSADRRKEVAVRQWAIVVQIKQDHKRSGIGAESVSVK